MRTAKELAELLAGEQFQGLDMNRRKIVREASRSLIFAVTLSEAISIYVTKDQLREIMDYATARSVRMLSRIFGYAWTEPDFETTILKNESPSD